MNLETAGDGALRRHRGNALWERLSSRDHRGWKAAPTGKKQLQRYPLN
jgi:hypothetical protein